ncbi:TPA: hypothetical protein NPN98_005324, partial [Klebsiella variicola subsp. variicola]|nr:hypothetical protein [Klebsiella variicola subsp. variicola]
EAPPEIPRVSSSNSSGLYTINVSFSRMDFAINNIEKGLKEVDITSDFISKSKLIIKNLPDNIYLNRIGIIGSFFEFEKSPAISLARKIIKKDLGNVSEFNFRYNKLSSDFGHTFNNILSINNAIFEAENASHHSEGILIQKDINNIPTENPISKDLLIEMLLKKIKELGTEHIEGSL